MSRPPLTGPARSLARPVARGGLDIEVADAVLIRAADRDPETDNLSTAWRALQAVLRHAVAETAEVVA
jgi:hypothetical protein